MSFKVIFLISLFFCSKIFGQKVDSSFNTINRDGFSINVNYIYNFCANKKPNTWILPNGKLANDNSGDSVYYMTFRNIDTKTFNINALYNKFIYKKISFSFGIGFMQRKTTTKYVTYIDSNIYKPNKLNYKHTSNSIIIPLRINYFKNRFCISFGNNIGIYHINNDIINYENSFKRSYHTNGFLSDITHIESVSYQIMKRKFVYINLCAEQSHEFYKKQGYNNWFMLGGTYLF